MFRLINRSQNLFIACENSCRGIATSSVCFAEPLRKKKVVNPATTKKQYDRKVRKLEREIRVLENAKPKLKPILELQIPLQVKREIDARIRSDGDEVAQKLLNSYFKVWSIYKSLEGEAELRHIKNCVRAQENALKVLKSDYPELYKEAVQLDQNLIPFQVTEVRKETPAVENFSCPDGKQQDITKEWKL